MLTGIAGAILVVAAIVMVRFLRVRRSRMMDRDMRDYVRRSY